MARGSWGSKLCNKVKSFARSAAIRESNRRLVSLFSMSKVSLASWITISESISLSLGSALRSKTTENKCKLACLHTQCRSQHHRRRKPSGRAKFLGRHISLVALVAVLYVFYYSVFLRNVLIQFRFSNGLGTDFVRSFMPNRVGNLRAKSHFFIRPLELMGSEKITFAAIHLGGWNNR